MYKVFLSLILCLSFVLHVMESQAASTLEVLEGLRNANPDIVEKTCKSLGLDRGASGLSKVQVFFPCCAKADNSLAVFSISWEGPTNGYIILMDPKGDVIDKKRVGYIKNISLNPLRPESSDDLIIDAIKGTGTGMRDDLFYIFSISNQGFKELWSELSYEKSFPLAMAKGKNYEIKGTVVFEDIDGDDIKEIIYSTRRTKYHFNVRSQKLLPSKSERKVMVYKLTEGKYFIFKKYLDGSPLP